MLEKERKRIEHMNNLRKLKIKENIDKRKYKKATNEFYDEIKEMIIKNAYMSKFQQKGLFIPCFQYKTRISVY